MICRNGHATIRCRLSFDRSSVCRSSSSSEPLAVRARTSRRPAPALARSRKRGEPGEATRRVTPAPAAGVALRQGERVLVEMTYPAEAAVGKKAASARRQARMTGALERPAAAREKEKPKTPERRALLQAALTGMRVRVVLQGMPAGAHRRTRAPADSLTVRRRSASTMRTTFTCGELSTKVSVSATPSRQCTSRTPPRRGSPAPVGALRRAQFSGPSSIPPSVA